MRRLALPVLALFPVGMAAAQSVRIPLPGHKVPGPTTAPVQPMAPAWTVLPAGLGRTPANPYGRAIDLTVNVQFFQRDLGELQIHLAADGTATFDAPAIATALKPILSDAGQARLAQALAGRQTITPMDLKAVGIDAMFNPADVVIDVQAIDPSLRRAVSMFGKDNDEADRATNASPASVSFFLNTGVSETRVWKGAQSGFRHPSVFLNSAARFGPIVVEASGQFADREPSSVNRRFHFDRNFARLVYDRPKQYLRAYLGDLTPEFRFQQNFVQMGGVGVSRQRRRFDDFRSAILQGNRQLLLQRESTVEVYRNGVLFQQLQLAPGAYDLGNLPLIAGSNDIRFSVKDGAGVSQTINYQTYLDPIDLAPGDFEFAAYAGKLSQRFGLSPVYDGEMAFTGFLRKAFIGHPALGVGLQASKSVQQFSAQSQFLISGGRLDMTAALSRSKLGNGYLASVLYDLALDQGDHGTSFNLQAVLQSRFFTGLGAPYQVNSTQFSGSAIVSRIFNPVLSTQVGVNFVRNRRPLGNEYRIFADGFYRISRRLFVRGGVDYRGFGASGLSARRGGLGFNASIVFQPRLADRAEARYDSRLNDSQLSYQHSPDGYVGSVGYGGVAGRGRGGLSVLGYANYVGNRFDASVSHSLSGAGLGQLADRQLTNFRVSSGLAFAGGAFAVTRRVGDSFAILTPHPSLKGHRVVVGQFLTDSRYRSRSDMFGGALSGSLASYVTQSIQYDVENPPPGYDVGLGVYRVRPAYHSGYHLIVGNDAYVTAVGYLLDAAGAPITTSGGQMLDLSRPKDKVVSFFTNSAGRFAVASLRPNDRYRVQLYSGPSFEFTVPADSEGLFDLHSVRASAAR